MSKKPSLYPTDDGCFVCHNPYTVTHHIYPGNGRRPISDSEGCTIQLCNFHHNMSDFGVHFDNRINLFVGQPHCLQTLPCECHIIMLLFFGGLFFAR